MCRSAIEARREAARQAARDSLDNREIFTIARDPALYDQLLSSGIVSNAAVRNGAGQTVLHRIPQIGVENKDVNTVELLSYVLTCDPSPDVNARHTVGHTPMAVAALSNNIAATKLLIDFGGDRTIRSNSNAGGSNPNSTPLDIAKQSNNEEIVKLLTEYFPSEE